MSTHEERLKNRLRLIHNKTLCDILEFFNAIPEKEYTIEEIKNKIKINTSTLFNSLKKLKTFGYINQVGRGNYKVNEILASSLKIMLDQLEERKLDIKDENKNIDNYLKLIRHYKNPEHYFPKLFSSSINLKISDLINSGISRATAFRILKELTDFGFLLKNEKEKIWGSTHKMDDLRNMILQEWLEIPGNFRKIVQQLIKKLPSSVHYKGIIVGTIAGFPIYTEYIGDKINEFTAMISAQLNIAIKQCKSIKHELDFIINIIDDGYIIVYAFEKIILAFVLYTEKKLQYFPKIIEILNDAAKKVELESKKLKIEY
ncbi:MAG: hypothetical protein ACTSRG_12135 [Candidatus Helarchaeota archaeon]